MKMKSKLNGRITLALLLMGSLIGTVHAETTVGRWCDEQIPTMPKYNGILEIVITDSGAVEMRSRYGDGSRGVTKLTEVDGGMYVPVASFSRHQYRIVPSNGDLQLLDNDGLIRVATRLENTPSPGECGIQ